MGYGWVESKKHKPQPNRFVWLLSVMADDIPFWLGIGYWNEKKGRFRAWQPYDAGESTPICLLTHWQYMMYPELETNKVNAIDPDNPPSGGSAITPSMSHSDYVRRMTPVTREDLLHEMLNMGAVMANMGKVIVSMAKDRHA